MVIPRSDWDDVKCMNPSHGWFSWDGDYGSQGEFPTLSFRRQVTREAEILRRDDSVAGSPVALWEIGP